jgi:hypothetical protein
MQQSFKPTAFDCPAIRMPAADGAAAPLDGPTTDVPPLQPIARKAAATMLHC